MPMIDAQKRSMDRLQRRTFLGSVVGMAAAGGGIGRAIASLFARKNDAAHSPSVTVKPHTAAVPRTRKA